MSDVVIIGGGIVGLATGYHLLIRNPDLKLTLLEKKTMWQPTRPAITAV